MSKVRLILLLLLILLAGAGYYWFTHGGEAQLPAVVAKLPAPLGKVLGAQDLALPASLPKGVPTDLTKNFSELHAGDQFSELTTQAKTAVDRAGTVLGTAIQISSGSGSLQEKTFNYARYRYCQQVVTDYESGR